MEGDVVVNRGLIVAVGPDAARGYTAAQSVDAKGLLVTPGFVDIHTHYDGQVTWPVRVLCVQIVCAD